MGGVEVEVADRQMHIALLLDGVGVHAGAWRVAGAAYGPENFSVMSRCARIAEAAKFDMVFVADTLVATVGPEGCMRVDALSLISALIGVTEKIGMTATVSTTYSEPYNVARMLGSVDHLSGGRAGWNVVTTNNAGSAANFGLDEHAPKEERYERAGEFVQIVKGLWDSWEDGVKVADRESGVFVDFSRQHAINHKGRFYSVKGPLNQSRPPQGHPVIVQAGGSETGMRFAAEIAEVVFTAENDRETAAAFNDRLRAMAASLGRDPSLIRFLPGVCPIVASSEQKAHEMLEEMARYVDPEVAWFKLEIRFGAPLRHLDLDGPLPTIPAGQMRGYAKSLTALANRNGYTLRQVRDYVAVGGGQWVLLGTPETIADELEAWFSSGAADGFVVLPAYLYEPFEAFTNEVIPVLQRRGLFRTDYSGSTLREHLGIPRPAHPLQLTSAEPSMDAGIGMAGV